MGKGKLRGEQIKDESIESVDIASGSIKAGELSTEAITGQALLNPADATNDRLLIWDADADALKKVSPENLGITATAEAAGSDGQVQYNNGGTATGGASGLYWDDVNNRVGIGTSNPDRLLSLEDADSAVMQFNATNYRAFAIGSDAYGFVIADGTTGGTAGYRFVISDQAAALGYVGIGAGASIASSNHPDALLHLSSSDDGAILRADATDGTTVLFATGSNRVGIGTASPANTLHVHADVSGDYVAVIDNDENSAGHVMKLTTDGTGNGTYVLDMESSSDTIFRARADGRFGFGSSAVGSMGAGTFVVGIDGGHTSDIAISKRLQHLGDGNTYMDFPSADQLQFVVGGVDILHVTEDGTQDMIVFNEGGADVDFRVESDSKTHALFVDGGTNQVLILSGGAAASYNEASGTDVNFYVSGSVGSQGTSTRGTAVFGGDVSISGSFDCVGNLYVADSAGMYTDKIRRYSDSDNTTKILLNDELIKLYAGHSSDDIVRIGDTNMGDDNNFWVSGSIGSQGTSTPGTAIFGGDVAVSGSISGSTFYGDGSNLTGIGGGGGGAPTDAQYITLATNGTLSNERVLTAGSGITLTDGGAGSTLTIASTGGGSASTTNIQAPFISGSVNMAVTGLSETKTFNFSGWNFAPDVRITMESQFTTDGHTTGSTTWNSPVAISCPVTTSATSGIYDIIVTNSDGLTYTVTDGLTVNVALRQIILIDSIDKLENIYAIEYDETYGITTDQSVASYNTVASSVASITNGDAAYLEVSAPPSGDSYSTLFGLGYASDLPPAGNTGYLSMRWGYYRLSSGGYAWKFGSSYGWKGPASGGLYYDRKMRMVVTNNVVTLQWADDPYSSWTTFYTYPDEVDISTNGSLYAVVSCYGAAADAYLGPQQVTLSGSILATGG